MNCVVSQHFITNKNAFIKYRLLNLLINNVRLIKDINELKILIEIKKIRLATNLKDRKKRNHFQ